MSGEVSRRYRATLWLGLVAGLGLACAAPSRQESAAEEAEAMGSEDVYERVEHRYADSDGVRIHYAALGDGPLVVFIHGFPDFWYTWREQMNALSSDFRVAAMDTRGYNLSDQPEGVDRYAMPLLVADVAAVLRSEGVERASIVGHDWGGAIAWSFAMSFPQMTERLVILNLPHPKGLGRELLKGGEQYEASAYARTFQEKEPDAPDVFFGGPMTAESLSGWVRDPEAKKRYVEAFERSDFNAMLSYYKANYPRLGPGAAPAGPPPSLPNVQAPVLLFHGLDDAFLRSDALDRTWDWLDEDLTLVTIPGAGHFVQQDAPELVTKTMKWWLLRDR